MKKVFFVGAACQRMGCECQSLDGAETELVPPLHKGCDCSILSAEVIKRAETDGKAGIYNEYSALRFERYAKGLELDGVVESVKIERIGKKTNQ
jgi:hypothetical protein